MGDPELRRRVQEEVERLTGTLDDQVRLLRLDAVGLHQGGLTRSLLTLDNFGGQGLV